jgi:hypothetical protein
MRDCRTGLCGLRGRQARVLHSAAREAREIFKKLYDAHCDEHGGERPQAPESGHVGLHLSDIQHRHNDWTSWTTVGAHG